MPIPLRQKRLAGLVPMKHCSSPTAIDPSATPEAESAVTSREATRSININDHGATSEIAAAGTS